MNTRKFIAAVCVGVFCLLSGAVHADPRAVDSPYCKARIFDVNKIANAKVGEMPKGVLHGIVEKSILNGNISEARGSDINVMIEEAYAAKDLLKWMKDAVADCTI